MRGLAALMDSISLCRACQSASSTERIFPIFRGVILEKVFLQLISMFFDTRDLERGFHQQLDENGMKSYKKAFGNNYAYELHVKVSFRSFELSKEDRRSSTITLKIYKTNEA